MRSAEPRVSEDEVSFLPGKGTPGKGSEPGGHYWHLYVRGVRAGRAYINYHESTEGEPRPSITVELNRPSRGRGIGTIAFRKAAELSGYDRVFAAVAKKNIASHTALERAGYKPVAGWTGLGLYLVWERSSQNDRRISSGHPSPT